MKYIAALAALAATAAATPAKRGEPCTFGTYDCTADDTGIRICNVSGQWELVGPCPTGTSCEFLPQNGFELPFCTSTPAQKKRDYNWCATPGQYTCDGWGAIQVCNTTNQLEKVGDCPKGSHCDYINNIPFCIN